MARPVNKTLYLTTGSLSGFAALSEIVPTPFTSSAFGWGMGQNNPPLYAEMSRSYEVLRTDGLSWLSTPSASIPNPRRGNCWATGPYHGEFTSGSWQVSMSIKSATRSDNQRGRFIYRIWQGHDIGGGDATLVSPRFFSSSINPANGTGAAGLAIINLLTGSLALPNISLVNEYIFIQTYWSIFAQGGNNQDDENYVFGPNASVIKPTSYIDIHTQIITCYEDGL